MKKVKRNGFVFCLLLPFLGFSFSANAFTEFNAGALDSLTNAYTESLLETVAIGADHQAYRPASTLGIALGLDVGVDVTFITFPDEFQDALTTLGNADVPSSIPLPRLSVYKGLPANFDLGFSYVGLSGMSIISGAVQWGVMQGVAYPSLALRASYTTSNLWFLKTNTTTIDAVVSKGLVVAEPYAGLGYQIASGNLDVTLSDLPSGVTAEYSGSSLRAYLGVKLNLALLKITPQYTYSFTGLSNYGVKLSLAF